MRRLALVAGLVGCLSLEEPAPTLSVSACSYFQDCVPGFSTTFQSIDTCIDALDEQPSLVNRCGAGAEAVDACVQLLRLAQPTCERIDEGACRTLISCASATCEGAVAELNAQCAGFEISPESASGWCAMPAGECVVDCLGSHGCATLQSKFLENVVASCALQCGVF